MYESVRALLKSRDAELEQLRERFDNSEQRIAALRDEFWQLKAGGHQAADKTTASPQVHALSAVRWSWWRERRVRGMRRQRL